MGIVTGRVFNSQGKPVEYARVTGSVTDWTRLGQVEDRTDSNGCFTLEYQGDSPLGKIWVDGVEKRSYVSSGSDITLIK